MSLHKDLIANIEAAIQSNTTFMYLESPNTMTFELQDLQACAALAKRHELARIDRLIAERAKARRAPVAVGSKRVRVTGAIN